MNESGERTYGDEMPLALRTFTSAGEPGARLERLRTALISTVPDRLATADAERLWCLPT